MSQTDMASSEFVLGSDDLELLQRFLEAWCEEHGVDPRNEKAAEVASALIDWYKSDVIDRNLLKSNPPELSPKPARIQHLLQQLAGA